MTSNPTPGNLPTRNENTCSYKDMYINVHSNIIHTNPKVEIIQNAHHLVNEYTKYGTSYNGILFSH